MVSGLLSGLMKPDTSPASVQSTLSEEIHIQAFDDRTAEEKRPVDFTVKLLGSEERLVVL